MSHFIATARACARRLSFRIPTSNVSSLSGSVERHHSLYIPQRLRLLPSRARQLSQLVSSASPSRAAQRSQATSFSYPLQVNTRLSSSLTTEQYHHLADAWMEAMFDTFEDLIDRDQRGSDYDVSYSDGVLTLKLAEFGTYVINKQTPNKQIWLSSPVSGPKRFDWIDDQQAWVYSHDNVALDTRLTTELEKVFGKDIDFSSHLHLH
eukprot:m.57110 g.57110  ORF g.57110 m.57110 type:complete len:207 (-) comp13053_c1_seq1:373-993(-)